jgi:hypothetical protein
MTSLKDFYFVYFPVGESYIRTMMCTFKYIPSDANVIVVSTQPDYFKDVKVNFNLIVLNLDDLRDEWSIKNETIIYETNQNDYTIKLKENLLNNKRFPYGFHRCILPWLSERNITKFVILDTDCLINYYGELNDVFNHINNKANNDQYIFGPIMSETTEHEAYISVAKNIFEKCSIDLDIIKNMPSSFTSFDGQIRGFWFNNTEDVMLFYTLWDKILKECYNQNSHLLQKSNFVISEAWLFSLVVYVLEKIRDIKHDDFCTNHRIVKHIYHPENDHFFLNHSLYKNEGLNITDSRIEFYQNYRNELIEFYRKWNGIEANRIKEVIYDWIY